ncbi:polyribonucleotide nucleotidyltransferase, partial [Candidatus Latescibacterota bacterium]
VCVDKKPCDRDFLPLTVEYREKSYSIGKIPGNFFKREARPNLKEILSARQIDRPLRPLFPKGFVNEVQVIVTVLSSDQINDQDTLGLIGTSCACMLSPLPLDKYISAVHVGFIDGQYIINPTFQQLEESALDIIVSGSDYDILMVEGSCREVSEEVLNGALEFAKPFIKEICDLERELCDGLRKTTMDYAVLAPTQEMIDDIRQAFFKDISEALIITDKSERNKALLGVSDRIAEMFQEKYPECEKQLAIRGY